MSTGTSNPEGRKTRENLCIPPPKPLTSIMAPVKPTLLLLRPLPLSSHCLNAKRNNLWTNQSFIKITLHFPNKMLPIRTHIKLKQTLLYIVKHFLKLETPTLSSMKTKPKACLVFIFLSIFSYTLCSLFIFDFLFDYLVL